MTDSWRSDAGQISIDLAIIIKLFVIDSERESQGQLLHRD